MLIDEGLEVLSEDECSEMLRSATVGRIGITIGALPVIFPVTYGVVDGDIIFQAAPGSKLEAAARHAVVAFEVDDYDRAGRQARSVLVVGRADLVHEPAANNIRIRPEIVSGHRSAPFAAEARPDGPGFASAQPGSSSNT